MPVNFSDDKFLEARLSLGFDDFLTLKCVLQKSNRSKADSMWGKLASIIFGVNRDNKRSFLNARWRHNSGNIQEILSEKMMSGLSELSNSFDRAIGHVRDSVELASDLDLVELGSSISLEHLSLGNLERVLFDDILVSIWASGCESGELISKYHTSISPPDSDEPEGFFWHGNNCDSAIWLESLKLFGLECPLVEGGFLLVNEKLNEACQRFVTYMLDQFEFVQAWLIAENINCRFINNLFGKSYLMLKTKQLDMFLSYLENLRENSDCSICDFYDIFREKILNLQNKRDTVVSTETKELYDVDNTDPLLIDEGSLIINEVIIDPTVCNEEITFNLSKSEWGQMTSLKGDNIIFSKDWTNLFNSKIENKYQCVLCFKYKKVNKTNSRKRNCCFFKAKAACKFNNCFEFSFLVRNNPFTVTVDDIVVNCTVSGTLSPEHDDGKTVHARHLSNTN